MKRLSLAFLCACAFAWPFCRLQAGPASGAAVAGSAAAAKAANAAARSPAGSVFLQTAMVLGTGTMQDSPATVSERVAAQAERDVNITSAVAEEENRLFTQFAWVKSLMDTLAQVNQGIEMIQQTDDAIALSVRYGADFLEFINSLSGPRRGSFFYDSETIAQVNRTVNEYQKLKHWKASFDFSFDLPTDRVAQPTGVTWDTINRRLGVAVDKIDSVIDEVSPMDKTLRKSLQLAGNNAVLNFSTQTAQKASAFIARNSVMGNKIAAINMRILKEMAELDGRKLDAQIMKETAADLAQGSAKVAALEAVQNQEERQLAKNIVALKSARPSMTGGESMNLQRQTMGDVFYFPEDDESALEYSGTRSRSASGFNKGSN
jgi:hypothetical protein